MEKKLTGREIFLPEVDVYNDKMIRQFRLIEAAVDGMHLSRALDLIDLIYPTVAEDEQKRLDTKKARLTYTLRNCDAFLKSTLTDAASA